MQSKSNSVNQEDSIFYNVANSTACSEPWWNNAGYNSFSSAMRRETASDSSSLEQSEDGQSQSEGGTNQEDDDTAKKSPKISYGKADSTIQHVPSTLDPRNEGILMQAQPSQPELGHSIACASNPYDPYYGGMMAAYGPPLVPSHLYDMNHTRMPLPLDMAPEPVYVNAKQYHGILRRRQSRAKAELQKKLIKVRKPYLHESRHQHALRRERGSGGRFAKKSDNDTPKPKEKGSNSSGFKPLLSESNRTNTVPEACNMYRNQTNFEEQAHQSHIGKTGEGGVSGQQWGKVTSNRALAMQ